MASVVTGGALIGGGSAAAAGPTQVTCSLDVTHPTAPVSVAPGSSVQLAVPLLGILTLAGPPQTVGSSGTQVLQGSVLVGLVATLCQAAVTIEAASPVPAITLPPVPAVLPPLVLPAPALPQLPGASGGAPAAAGPAAGTPAGASTPQGGSAAQGGSPAPAAGGPAPAAAPDYAGSVDHAQAGDLLSQVSTGTATQYSFGRVPLYSYAGTPYSVAGGAGRGLSPSALYGSAVPGYSPQLGSLGSRSGAGTGDGVARASQVEALGSASTPGTVGIVTLLAVLLLSGTSAALVRTAVLRRTVLAVA